MINDLSVECRKIHQFRVGFWRNVPLSSDSAGNYDIIPLQYLGERLLSTIQELNSMGFHGFIITQVDISGILSTCVGCMCR